MKKAEKAVLGTWRITRREVWDADYFDMVAPAHITLRAVLTGEFQFGLVPGGRIGVAPAQPCLRLRNDR